MILCGETSLCANTPQALGICSSQLRRRVYAIPYIHRGDAPCELTWVPPTVVSPSDFGGAYDSGLQNDNKEEHTNTNYCCGPPKLPKRAMDLWGYRRELVVWQRHGRPSYVNVMLRSFGGTMAVSAKWHKCHREHGGAK